MKNLRSLSILFFTLTVLLFSSCEKRKIKNCVEDMIGSYTSLSDCYGDTSYAGYYGLTLLSGSADEEIAVNFAGYVSFTLVVNDSDCNFVIPPTELYSDYSDPNYTYSQSVAGTGNFDEESGLITMSLQIIYSYNGVQDDSYTCAISFRKL